MQVTKRRIIMTLFALASGVGMSACYAPGTKPPPPQFAFPGPDWHTYSLASWYIHTRPKAICIRAHESDTDDFNKNGLHDGGYQAVNSVDGLAKGAYQFKQGTWDSWAPYVHPELVGVRPDQVGVVFQDEMFWYVWHHAGYDPWRGSGC